MEQRRTSNPEAPPEEPPGECLGADSPEVMLLDAAARGDIGGARSALADGAESLDAALVAAADTGQTVMAGYLMGAGADPLALDCWPARRAAEKGHLDVLDALLGRVGEREALDMALVSLSDAASRGHREIVQWLFANTAATLADAGDAPLHRAAMSGHPEVVALLLDRADAEEADKLSEAARHQRRQKRLDGALGWAGKSERPEAARLLLTEGADLDALEPVPRQLVERLLAKNPEPAASSGAEPDDERA